MAEPRAAQPSIFFMGGGLIYAFIFTIISLHKCIRDLIGLPSILKPGKDLHSRDFFFNILFVVWGEQKNCTGN